jgi:hypothetical protein
MGSLRARRSLILRALTNFSHTKSPYYSLHPNSQVVSPRLHITKSHHRTATINTTTLFCTLFPASIRASTPFPAFKSSSFGRHRVPIPVHHAAINCHQAHSDRKTDLHQPLKFFRFPQLL